MSLTADYFAKLETGELSRDPAQEAAIKHLESFLTRWRKPRKKNGLLQKLTRKKPAPVKGVYMYGGVGRGKTMLMDLLVAHVHSDRVRRVHFHAFMLEVHGRLKVIRDAAQTDDFLGTVAHDICLLYTSDAADE